MKKIDRELKATVRSAYGYAWEILKENFISLFLIFLVLFVAGMPMAALQTTHGIEDISVIHAVLIVFMIGYGLFILNPIEYGAKWVHLKIIRQDEFDVKEMFDGFKNYLNVVLAALIASVIIGFGIAFFIVPGIIFACRLAFVPYLVMDKNLDPVKAVEESWRLTRGYGWKIFGIFLLAIPIFIAGLIVFLIGAIVAGMWIRTTLAAMYEAVLIEKGEKNGVAKE